MKAKGQKHSAREIGKARKVFRRATRSIAPLDKYSQSRSADEPGYRHRSTLLDPLRRRMPDRGIGGCSHVMPGSRAQTARSNHSRRRAASLHTKLRTESTRDGFTAAFVCLVTTTQWSVPPRTHRDARHILLLNSVEALSTTQRSRTTPRNQGSGAGSSGARVLGPRPDTDSRETQTPRPLRRWRRPAMRVLRRAGFR